MNFSNQEYFCLANAIRQLTIDAVEKAESGHPGMPMGMADVATILFSEFLKFVPYDPLWANRDRFVLSAGHGSMLLYSLLYLTGYIDITIEDIKNFRQLNSKTAGHPELHLLQGVETTTGPLGQGLANAVGMAIAEQKMQQEFGYELVNHYTYAIVGDGCLMEGIGQEAISLAGHLQLDKLIVLFDDNNISIDGKISLTSSENHLERFNSCNWHVQSINGHDYKQIREALVVAQNSPLPSLIACKTIIGFGSPNLEGTEACHGSSLGKQEAIDTKRLLSLPEQPFNIEKEILERWRKIGKKDFVSYEKWKAVPKSEEFKRRINNVMPENWENVINDFLKKDATSIKTESTRKSSGRIIELLMPVLPELIGGSADLTTSTFTKGNVTRAINKYDFSGQFIHYGIREHAMSAIMNGLALHNGFIPFGGTFLVFSDYCRPAIRLSALMQIRVIYIMTHDSIGVGEDGPTHQPIEHLAGLRAIPNLLVLRPADLYEVAECWKIALKHKETPSVLCLTRQSVPTLERSEEAKQLIDKGAYIVDDCQEYPDITIFATGSEVSIALETKKILIQHNLKIRVISVPCLELFKQSPTTYQASLIDNNSLKVVIETGIQMCWDFILGRDDLFFGMKTFGKSAKAEDLYEYFGITSIQIAEKILEKKSSL